MNNFLKKLFLMNGDPSCRLLLGSFGFFIFMFLIVLTVLFNFNGTPEHVDLMKHLGYISASLLGLSAIDFSHLKYNKKDKDEDENKMR